MYARLCQRLSEEAPDPEDCEPYIFRRVLLNCCRAQFETRSDEKNNKRKSLGNIKFIGELYKLNLVGESILHDCIQKLLQKKDVDEMAEDLECLCQIMRTCGQILDSKEKARSWVDRYFDRMGAFSNNPALPIRIRFMLRDIIELRKAKWVPRKAISTEGPLPITQVGDEGVTQHAPQRERLPQQELFKKTRPGFDSVLSSSLSFAQTDKFPLYNSNGFQGGFRDRVPQRQQNHHHQQQNSSNFYQQNRYNNQHNNNNSNNLSSTKDIPPRFKRMITGHEQSLTNLEEVSLRPPAQSMVFKPPNAKPPSQLFSGSKGPGGLLGEGPKTNPPPIQTTKEMPILIKQASMERSKPSKKDKAITKEETLKKVNSIGEELLNDENNINEAVTNYSQLKVPDRLNPECLQTLLSKTYDKTDNNRETVMSFIILLKKDEVITPLHFHEAFRSLLKSVPDVETTVPKVYNYISEFASKAVTNGLLTIAQIGEVTEDGSNFPLLLLTLQNLSKATDKQELVELFNKSNVCLMNSLSEGERTKEHLKEVLEERELVFLEPMLVLEGELWSALEREPSAQSLYKCAKESVDPSHHQSPPFVTALLTVCLRYITQESTRGKDAGAPEKALQEKEKALLARFKTVLQAFLRENVNLQVTAVHALQVFCYSLGFPKGMLLRWFINLYDLEIVEEEAFLKWREDVNDAYPGKGNALFQVNQWLTWLATAESEEEEEDEGDN